MLKMGVDEGKGLSKVTSKIWPRQASSQIGLCASASSLICSADTSPFCYIWNWMQGVDGWLVDLPMVNQENLKGISAINKLAQVLAP